MRHVFVFAMLGIVAAAGSAQATGVCENNPRQFEPSVSWSATEKQLAIPATQDWCEEKDEGGTLGEQRGTVRFVEIRDISGTVVERLSSERGAQAKRLKESVGEFKVVPSEKMPQTLKARGFVPLSAKAVSPAGGCTTRLKWAKSKETVNGFPAGSVSVEVVAAKKVLASADLGLAARQRRGDLALRSLFIADGKSVVVWARVPQCSGPPPGYFDKDFAGDCYAGDEIVIKQLTATANAELAACFVADPPKPPKP